MKERIGYYDLARGVGIIFVVIGHIDSFYMPFRSFVTSFHMALFLMLSGMLAAERGTEEKPWGTVALRKVKGVLVPYWLFSILSVTIEGLRLLSNGTFYWPHLESLLLTTATFQGISVMWFLPALFFSELLFLALRKGCCRIAGTGKRAGGGRRSEKYGSRGCSEEGSPARNGAGDVLTIMSVLVLMAFSLWGNLTEQRIYYRYFGAENYKHLHEFLGMLFRSIFCSGLICAGYYFRKYVMYRSCRPRGDGLTGAGLLVLCGIVGRINPGVDLKSMYFGEFFSQYEQVMGHSAALVGTFPGELVRGGLYMLGAFLGGAGTIFLCRAFSGYAKTLPGRILTFFGVNSLVIMATHIDFHVLHYSMEVANFFNQKMASSFGYHVVLLSCIFAAETVLILIMNKCFPVLGGKFKNKKEFS